MNEMIAEAGQERLFFLYNPVTSPMTEPWRMPDFWTAVFTGVLALTAVVALVIGYRQLKEFHAEAQVQHLLALDQKFDQEPMLTYRRVLAEKRLKNEEEDPDELYPLLAFFETVA